MALKRGPTRGRDNANAALNLKDCQQKAGKKAATGFSWISRGSLYLAGVLGSYRILELGFLISGAKIGASIP